MTLFIFLRGGGDLASGVALRLYRAGLSLLITELAQPLTVRRLVSFSEAVFQGQTTVEGVTARLASNLPEALAFIQGGEIPVLVDPSASCVSALRTLQPTGTPIVLVDARMTKHPPERDTLEELFRPLFAEGLRHLRIDVSGRDGVDSNAARADLLRDRAG